MNDNRDDVQKKSTIYLPLKGQSGYATSIFVLGKKHMYENTLDFYMHFYLTYLSFISLKINGMPISNNKVNYHLSRF